MENRKKDHIELAFKSQTPDLMIDERFNYEPLLSAHPSEELKEFHFLGKTLRTPIWVSSMTGGTELAGKINGNLAKACREFGMGMGLGSCRIILEDDKYLSDFNVRDIIGDDLPLYANLGINQLELILKSKKIDVINNLILKLHADGLIIHVNPLQEWLQPEGDRLGRPAVEVLREFLEVTNIKVIVKEVGQGFGPKSLSELMKLPLSAVDFGAYGGTNFAKLELLRQEEENAGQLEAFSSVGHSAGEMVDIINTIIVGGEVNCREIIISGGIKNFLDGYYLINKIKLPAIYGQASALLKYAMESYDALRAYILSQIKGLAFADAFLTLK